MQALLCETGHAGDKVHIRADICFGLHTCDKQTGNERTNRPHSSAEIGSRKGDAHSGTLQQGQRLVDQSHNALADSSCAKVGIVEEPLLDKGPEVVPDLVQSFWHAIEKGYEIPEGQVLRLIKSKTGQAA